MSVSMDLSEASDLIINNGGDPTFPAPQFVSPQWDNCRMKRFSALLAFLLLFSLNNVAPAEAIFGLSKCEKAKAQITSLENKMSKYLNNVRGDYYTNNVRGFDEKISVSYTHLTLPTKRIV